MTKQELEYVKGALAALSQPKIFPADINYARHCLEDAIFTHEHDNSVQVFKQSAIEDEGSTFYLDCYLLRPNRLVCVE